MAERYVITGVQLGMLIVLENKQDRLDIANEIIDKQFIGSKTELKEILKKARENLEQNE